MGGSAAASHDVIRVRLARHGWLVCLTVCTVSRSKAASLEKTLFHPATPISKPSQCPTPAALPCPSCSRAHHTQYLNKRDVS